jgi:hypothetical protein
MAYPIILWLGKKRGKEVAQLADGFEHGRTQFNVFVPVAVQKPGHLPAALGVGDRNNQKPLGMG